MWLHMDARSAPNPWRRRGIGACAASNNSGCGFRSEAFGVPGVKDYTSIISSLGKKRFWLQAVDLLWEILGKMLEPDVITYSSSISACEKGQQWATSLGLLRQVQQRRIEPDVITYTISIGSCYKSQEWAVLLSLLHSMHRVSIEIDRQIYNLAVSACESRRDGPVEELLHACLGPHVLAVT